MTQTLYSLALWNLPRRSIIPLFWRSGCRFWYILRAIWKLLVVDSGTFLYQTNKVVKRRCVCVCVCAERESPELQWTEIVRRFFSSRYSTDDPRFLACRRNRIWIHSAIGKISKSVNTNQIHLWIDWTHKVSEIKLPPRSSFVQW